MLTYKVRSNYSHNSSSNPNNFLEVPIHLFKMSYLKTAYKY